MKTEKQREEYYIYSNEELPLMLYPTVNGSSKYSSEELVIHFGRISAEKATKCIKKSYNAQGDYISYDLISKTRGKISIHMDRNFTLKEENQFLYKTLEQIKRTNDILKERESDYKTVIAMVALLAIIGFNHNKISEFLIDLDNKQYEKEWKQIESSWEYQNYLDEQAMKQKEKEKATYDAMQKEENNTEDKIQSKIKVKTTK